MESDTSSAMGNAHHTYCTLPDNESRYAAGSNTTSCLAMDITMLYTPFPRAWNKDPQTMQNPAKRKLKLIALSAGTPMESIISDASKSENKGAGNNWNTTKPNTIIPIA